jgi:hypothetical protein
VLILVRFVVLCSCVMRSAQNREVESKCNTRACVHVDFVNMTACHRHLGKFQVSMVALLLLCPQFCFVIVSRGKHFMGLRCIQTLASEMLNVVLLVCCV